MVTFTQPDNDTYENDDAEPWKPKQGSPQQIVGKVLERKLVNREDGTEVEFLKVEEKQGGKTWLVWISPTMLRKCIARDNPQPGDTWGVEYQGSKPIGQGRSVDLYGTYHKAASRSATPDMSNGPADSHVIPADDEPF